MRGRSVSEQGGVPNLAKTKLPGDFRVYLVDELHLLNEELVLSAYCLQKEIKLPVYFYQPRILLSILCLQEKS